jgi:hypothetical protein
MMTGKNEVFGEGYVALLLCPAQIPRGNSAVMWILVAGDKAHCRDCYDHGNEDECHKSGYFVTSCLLSTVKEGPKGTQTILSVVRK